MTRETSLILAALLVAIGIVFSGGIYTVSPAPLASGYPGIFRVNKFTGTTEYKVLQSTREQDLRGGIRIDTVR
jgi:hypothetical protein